MSVRFYLHATQYSGFIGAQITNSILLYLLFTRAEKLFGSYRYVMGVFAMYSLVYTWIEIVTQPIMHIHGPMFIVMMDSALKYQTWIGNILTCLYCGSFAFCVALLAVQFFYRYMAVCKPNQLITLNGIRLLVIFVPCILCFVAWFASVYFGMHNTVEKQLFMKSVIMEYYGEDLTKVSFIAGLYWTINENGNRVWRGLDLMGSAGCTLLIIICCYTILFCAVSIYRKLKDAEHIMSARTKELNKQLFITLLFQTILPFLMMYGPVGLILTLPLFEIDIGRLANVCGACCGTYPAIEPVIAIFCIKDFRRTILCQRKRERVTPSRNTNFTEYRITSDLVSSKSFH